jgi:hypothetical protein
MKPTAYFINTARGPIVDEDALHDALTRRTIAGAGLDVHTIEPRPQPDKFATLRNVILTPHIAGGSRTGVLKEIEVILSNARAVLAGPADPVSSYGRRLGNGQMLDRTENLAALVESWLGQFERALAQSSDAPLNAAVFCGELLARCIGAHLGHPHDQRRGHHRQRTAGARRRRRDRISSSIPIARPPRRVTRAGHGRDRSDLPVRDGARARQRRVAARVRFRRWQRQGLDAAHGARRDQGTRGAGRQIAAER